MASTAGRKLRPLPDFLTRGLENLGYRRMPFDHAGAPFYRHPRHPDLFCTVVVGNLPGDDAVVADWKGQPPTRLTPDNLIDALRIQLEILDSPVQRMRQEVEASD